MDDKFLIRELRVRRQLADIYNRTLEQCGSKEDYDQYLEDVEDIIFTLVENERDPAAQEQINAYKAKYADEIAQNNAHKAEQQRKAAAEAAAAAAEAAGTSETGTSQQAAQQQQEDAPPSAAAKLMHSSMESMAQLETQPAAGHNGDMLPMPTAPAQMTADGVLQQGAPQSRDQYWKAAKASGWTEDFPKKRNLQEAFGSLWIS